MRTAPGGLTGSPNWVLFSPDGKTVVSTNLDGTVTLWDVESATPLETLRGHSNSVQQPVFSPDGRDALHGESRRHRDCLGSLRRPQARAALHVHARPSVLLSRL